METNAWTLMLVGAIVFALLVVILIKNYKDKREFYESLNAANDLSAETDQSNEEE